LNFLPVCKADGGAGTITVNPQINNAFGVDMLD
jgi:hypothetical protein